MVMYLNEASLGLLSKSGMALRLNPNEWKVLVAATKSLSVAKVSENASLPYSTVIDVVKRLARLKIGISFVPHLDKMGLRSVFLLYEDKPLRSLPIYTQTVYKLLSRKRYLGIKALIPENLEAEYVSAIPGEPLYSVRTTEVRYWTPEGKLTKYLPGYNIVLPSADGLDDVLAAARSLPHRYEKLWVDWVDLVIVYFKLKYAYTKLSDMARLIKESFGLEPPSRQLMSYHYRSHVVGLWAYNRTVFRLNTALVPMKLYLLTGKEGAFASRALVHAPYIFEALVGDSCSLVTGQPPSYLEPLIYEVLYSTNSEMPFGALLVTEEREMPWISPGAIEYYKNRGEFPEPTSESLQL